ncbi:hypothetical protein NCC49_000568, partial [Naganishia albida]
MELKGRIKWLMIDEAAQATEASTLIPLTLDVTNVIAIG